jgi:hypothetical protein
LLTLNDDTRNTIRKACGKDDISKGSKPSVLDVGTTAFNPNDMLTAPVDDPDSADHQDDPDLDGEDLNPDE